MPTDKNSNLLPCLARLAQLQQESVDRLEVHAAIESALTKYANNPKEQLKSIATQLQVPQAQWLQVADAARVPALLFSKQQNEWGVLRGQNAQGQWVSEWWDAPSNGWQERVNTTLNEHLVATFKLSRPYVASKSPVYQLIRDEIFAHKTLLREAVIGGLMINIVALATSFYSMQVYDRVIPASATQTLLVLTLGVLFAIIFELVTKRLRSSLYERLINEVDQRLARTIYLRFLAIRQIGCLRRLLRRPRLFSGLRQAQVLCGHLCAQ
jgi:ATP-binding cassette subfamily C protein LapB